MFKSSVRCCIKQLKSIRIETFNNIVIRYLIYLLPVFFGNGIKHESENPESALYVAFIVDFIDSENRYLKEHSLQRKSIVMETKGFAENVVKDFDFEGLGFTLSKSTVKLRPLGRRYKERTEKLS